MTQLLVQYRHSAAWPLVESIESKDPLLTQPERAGSSDEAYFDFLMASAELAREEFELFCTDIAALVNGAGPGTAADFCSVVGVPWTGPSIPMHAPSAIFRFPNELMRVTFGPPKSRDRALAKSAERWLAHLPEPRMRYCVTDPLRATFVFADPLVLYLCVQLVLQTMGEAVERVVNRMAYEHIIQPPNVNMNVRFRGVLVEVQFLLEGFRVVKKTLHKFYECVRAGAVTAVRNTLFDWQEKRPDFADALIRNARRKATQEQLGAIERLADAADVDKSGLIEFSEFFAAMQLLTVRLGMHDEDGHAAVEEQFRAADVDDDQVLSRQEFVTFALDLVQAAPFKGPELAANIRAVAEAFARCGDRPESRLGSSRGSRSPTPARGPSGCVGALVRDGQERAGAWSDLPGEVLARSMRRRHVRLSDNQGERGCMRLLRARIYVAIFSDLGLLRLM